MSRLTKKIELGQIGGIAMQFAKLQAEEAIARTLVAIDASKEEMKNVFVAAGKVVVTQAVKNYADNNLVDTLADSYTAIQVVKGGINLYKGVNKFADAYSSCTDENVDAVLDKMLGETKVTPEETTK